MKEQILIPQAPEKFKKRILPKSNYLMPDELHSEDFKKHVLELIKSNPNLFKHVSDEPTKEEIGKVIAELRKSRHVIESFKKEYGSILKEKPKQVAPVNRVIISEKKVEPVSISLQQPIQKPVLKEPEKVVETQETEDVSGHRIQKTESFSAPKTSFSSESEGFSSEPKNITPLGEIALQGPPEAKPISKKRGMFAKALSALKGKPKARSDEAKVALIKEDIPFEIDLFPKVITLPDTEDRTKINLRYPLLPPFAYAHIYWDDKAKELMYWVEEPFLTDKEKELLKLIQVALEEMINVPFTKARNSNFVSKYLQKNVQAILIELNIKITIRTYQKLMYYVYRDGIGMNDIEPLLKDYYIEDIECNGISYPLYIVHRKYGNLRTNVIYHEYDQLADFVEKLSQKTGRYVSYANPLLDGALPDGSRVNATYTKDITTRGPTFTIRKFTKEPWSPAHMISFKTATAELFAYLWLAIEYKFNIMVIGETGSGKTSFLNSILQFVPSEARITSVEDTRELNLMHDNWLPAVQRMGFGIPNILGQKYGEVSMFDLLKESFRQNPDYMVIGEVRGKEAYVLFQGMASGHPSYGTFHAGSVEAMIRRLETAPINLSASLVETMDIVVVSHHIKTAEKSIRRIKEVQEIIEVKGKMGDVETNQVFRWDALKDKIDYLDKSVVFDKITKRIGLTKEEVEREFARRTKLLSILEKKKILDFREFKKVINNYYKDKKGVLREFGIKI